MSGLFNQPEHHTLHYVANIFKNAELTPDVRNHLQKVYSTLALTFLAATAGACAHLFINLAGTLSQVATFGLLILLMVDRANFARRLVFLAAFGFFSGVNVGPLLHLALHIDPSAIVTALLCSLVIFTCFSLSALVAKRNSYLALGGVLSSGLTMLMVLSLLSLFVRSRFMFNVHLYLGLAIFCAYILYDTQLIMERFRMGDGDFVFHALMLFIDLLAIFVRILIILLKDDKKRSKK